MPRTAEQIYRDVYGKAPPSDWVPPKRKGAPLDEPPGPPSGPEIPVPELAPFPPVERLVPPDQAGPRLPEFVTDPVREVVSEASTRLYQVSPVTGPAHFARRGIKAGLEAVGAEDVPAEVVEQVARRAPIVGPQIRLAEKLGYDPAAGISTALGGATRLPDLAAAKAVGVIEGRRGADIVDPDVGQQFKDAIEQENREAMASIVAKHGDKEFVPYLKIKDVAELPQNLAFTTVSMAAGLAGGATGGPAGYASGAGVTAFRMSSNEIMTQYLNVMQAAQMMGREDQWAEELPEGLVEFRPGQPLTAEQQTKLKQHFDKRAGEYGLWEAGPEVLSQMVTLGAGRALASPLKSMVSKDVLIKMAASFGVEWGTEATTQTGQRGIEVRSGLADGPVPNWTSLED
ncbi:MAG: hypothetical protein ACYTEQ_18990, partial [Planctomycetota bacterium]